MNHESDNTETKRLRNELKRLKTDYEQLARKYEEAQDALSNAGEELKSCEHLTYFESMDRVNRAIQGTNDLNKMMHDVLNEVLDIFDCDRAYLLYPCDPDAESWAVPMECTRPEYPGANALNVDIPLEADLAEEFRIVRQRKGYPVSFGPEAEYPLPKSTSQGFNIQSDLAESLFPKHGNAWQFGIHQCAYPREWSEQECKLFEEIGRRLSDGLSSLLISHELEQSEVRFRQAFEFAGIGMGILSLDGNWLRANHAICDMLGYSEEELKALTYQELAHPDDLALSKELVPRLIAGEIPFMQIEKRYRHHNGHYLWAKLTTSIVRSETNAPPVFCLPDRRHR